MPECLITEGRLKLDKDDDEAPFPVDRFDPLNIPLDELLVDEPSLLPVVT